MGCLRVVSKSQVNMPDFGLTVSPRVLEPILGCKCGLVTLQSAICEALILRSNRFYIG